MKKIAILSGGTSSEREVALRSAAFFKKYLNKDFDFYDFPSDLEKFLENKDKYNLAIPIFHGQYGEDGKIFAFLEILGIDTTFSKYETHAICLNKYVTNELVSKLGVNVPAQFLYNGRLDLDMFPLIAKPNRGGSSMYTYKVSNIKEFNEKIADIKQHTTDDILVQEFVEAEEYSVSIVASEVLPIMKVQKEKGEFFDFENKYSDAPKIKETWPEIEPSLESSLAFQAKKIYNFFNCKGYARVDFLVKDNEIYFLEINTIPGMTEGSIVPKSWLKAGRNFGELVKVVVNDK
nr:ATP-grasp domain-containing protein [Candidatus Gracilibacteria bacterium]